MKLLEQENWWVLRAQAGEKEALNELFEAIQTPLYRYISGLVRDPHLAEDILQEVFIRIHRKIGWLREPKLFRSWAYRIATNETFRYLKKERQWSDQIRDELTLVAIPAPPRNEFSVDLIEQIPRLIAGISPASRAVVLLYYMQELSLEEVAAVLDIPLGTVKSRLAYGLERLRQTISK